MSTFPNDAEWTAALRRAYVRDTPIMLEDQWAFGEGVRAGISACALLVADRERAAAARALHDAADEIERLVDDQHPAALNPDQWLRDRADALEAGEDRG